MNMAFNMIKKLFGFNTNSPQINIEMDEKEFKTFINQEKIYLSEKINKDKLQKVIECVNHVKYDYGHLRNHYHSNIDYSLYMKSDGNVVYSQKNNFGRYYAKCGLSLMPREIRNYLCDGNYIDIDMVNSHCVLLEQLFIKYNVPIPEFLIEYNLDRSGTIIKYGFSSKIEMFKIMYTDNYNDLPYYENEILDFHKAIYYNLLPKLSDYNVPKEYLSRDNAGGVRLSMILQYIENQILLVMINKCSKLKIKVSVLIYDGFLVEKEDMRPDLLDILEKQVFIETGYKIKMIEKTMDTKWEPTNKLNYNTIQMVL